MSAIDRGLRPAPASRQSTRVRFAAIALALSLLVHIGLLILMFMDPPWSQLDDEEGPVTVDLVPSLPTPPPPPVAKVEAPKPVAPPEVKPEVKPEPKPEPAPEPAAPKIDLKRPPLVPPPEPKIDLKRPPLVPPPQKIELKKPPSPPPPPPAPPKINLHPVEVTEKSKPPPAAEKEPETPEHALQNLDPETRTISDLILTRVSGYWTPPPELRGVHATIHLVIDLKPNNMFGSPFAADGPWNPEAALLDLKKLHEDDPRYVALMSFYRTLRDIQPLKLPPGMASNQVRHVPVWFRLDDMP